MGIGRSDKGQTMAQLVPKNFDNTNEGCLICPTASRHFKKGKTETCIVFSPHVKIKKEPERHSTKSSDGLKAATEGLLGAT